MKAKHYTAWGDVIETFGNIPIVARSSGRYGQLMITGESNVTKCPYNFQLFEVTSSNELVNVFQKGRAFDVENVDNTFYCLPKVGITEMNNNQESIGGDDYSNVTDTDIVCPSDSFMFSKKCLKTSVFNITKEVGACFTAPLSQQQKVCKDVDVDSLISIYRTLPRPLFEASNDFVIENTTEKGIVYCPATHPVVIGDNDYAPAVCTNPNNFGIVFNRYCDEGDKLPCKLRLRKHE